IILKITGEQVKSFHTDISTTTGERVMVFKLFGNFEKKLMGKNL
ncbi:Na-translocating system protein MpsC family protein, partial [Bacillus sp. LL01]